MRGSAPSRDVLAVAGLGIAYVILLVVTPKLIALAGPSHGASTEPPYVPTLRLLIASSLIAGLLGATFLVRKRNESVALRTSLRSPTGTVWITYGGGTVVVSIGLAALHLWPWTWQWPPYSALDALTSLVSANQYAAVLIWAATAIIVTPVLEEVVFRFGLLRLIQSLTGSQRAGIIASALFFAAGHLGGTITPDRAHVTNAAWLFVASVLLGSITVRRGGGLQPAIAAHMARNAIEFVTMVIALSA